MFPWRTSTARFQQLRQQRQQYRVNISGAGAGAVLFHSHFMLGSSDKRFTAGSFLLGAFSFGEVVFGQR